MLTRWNDQVWQDVARALGDFEGFRRRMGGFFDDFDFGGPDLGKGPQTPVWPRIALGDDGEHFVLEAVLPGLTENEITLSLNRNVLTISGARQLQAPEGYSLQRRERGSVRFSRSVSLPGPVDPEQVKATVRDGLLTVRLTRAAEARPKEIPVESE